jgi:hypothetical protein
MTRLPGVTPSWTYSLPQAIPGRPGAVDHHPQILYAPTGKGHRIQHGGGGNDGRTVLVVVKHRDGHLRFQLFLDVKTVRRLDVFQVDAAEGGFHQPDGTNEFFRIGGIHFDVEHIDVGKSLEKDRLAFHDRFAGQRADIAKAQYGRPVGDHCNQIPPVGVVIGRIRVLFDFQAGRRHTGGIGQAEIGLAEKRLGGNHFGFSRTRFAVVAQRLLIVRHDSLLGPGLPDKAFGLRYPSSMVDLSAFLVLPCQNHHLDV